MIRYFSPEDQSNFAALSGDYNPLHFNIATPRFPRPVVHGMHLVLHALNQLQSPRILNHLEASFKCPLLLDDPFSMKVIESGESFEAHSTQCNLSGRFSSDEISIGLPRTSDPLVCRQLSFIEAKDAQGYLPLYIDEHLMVTMFPAIHIPGIQIAEILATTRLTGMVCPGAHTMLLSFSLDFQHDSRSLDMQYNVSHYDERFSTMKLTVISYNMSGEINVLHN
jgi:hypothetical protein